MFRSKSWSFPAVAGSLLLSLCVHAQGGFGISVEKTTNGLPADTAYGQMPVLTPGQAIIWRYRISNTGVHDLHDLSLHDDLVGPISCPGNFLPSGGPAIVCEAHGVAEDLEFGPAHIVSGLCEDDLGRPVYRNQALVTAYDAPIAFAEEQFTATDLSHYCNPVPPAECGVSLDLSCQVPAPPPPNFDKCSGKLKQFTLRWPEDQSALTLTGGLNSNDADGVIEAGQLVTFFNPGDDNDVFVYSDRGSSVFHMSCSDPDMNDPSDCGKAAGDGKDNRSGMVTNWQLAGFIDAEDRNLVCPGSTNDTPVGSEHCEIGPLQDVSCADRDKPRTLTFRYLGEGAVADCTDNAASRVANKEPSCAGNLAPGDSVTISLDDGSATPTQVSPGAEFDITGHRSNTTVNLVSGSRGETDIFHTSCSTAFEVGDRFGNLLLVAMDGDRETGQITWLYTVTNASPVDVVVNVVDDALGEIVSAYLLGTIPPANQHTFSRTVHVENSPETINASALVLAALPGDDIEFDLCDSDTASASILAPPPCVVESREFKISDDKIEWKLKNHESDRVTIQSIAIVAPAAYGQIKKIKLDGDLFKDDTRPVDWTFTEADFHPELKRRQIKANYTKSLIIEFTDKYKSASRGDFQITVTFSDGCSVTL